MGNNASRHPHKPAEQLAEQWQHGQPPDVFVFLAERPSLSPREQLEVLLVDQHRRWKSGRPCDVQQYLDRCPTVNADAKLKFELLSEEVGYQEEFEDSFDVRRFADRFPEVRDALLADSAEASIVGQGTGSVSTQLRENVERTPRPSDEDTAAKPVPTKDPELIKERYRIQGKLGQGTFGVVYLGYDEALKRQVAIKLPRFLDPDDGDSFLREARNVAQLDHPGIIPVYDAGRTEEGVFFVISRYVDGKDLSRLMHDARWDVRRAAELMVAVAEALHYAHRNGLVHRDIKPANIVIDDQQRPHLTDFGLALKDEDFGTGHGFAGTPAYMSPEQARGEGHRVDPRSDIYSLGVVFYELLTGQRPYFRDQDEDLLEQVRRADPRPPRQIDDSIPRELERICLKMLARRLADRYSTAIDFADDLRSFLNESSDEGSTGSDSTTTSTGSEQSDATNEGRSLDSDSAEAAIRIVPKGMRSFDEDDRDFFIELVPGPRDRTGMPDSIRFWKTRIEQLDSDETFSVGLVYGPSGCGKSSLMKAGVLPRLPTHTRTIYVEASGSGTESQILRALRKEFPELPPNADLTAALAMLRRDRQWLASGKLLIVIDQFEQWLHTWDHDDDASLIQSLRQCDGGHVQCIVMVRDDFWMAATRFMMELEVRLIEGFNSAAVDLFDQRHARKVLAAYGRAYGSLPARPSDLTKSHQLFITQAVDDLAQDGKIIPVRLALFAEMVKGRPWIAQTLRDIGGAKGVGVAFLEEAFGPTSPPLHRYYAASVRSVLGLLLPETGSNIKGHMRSQQELIEACGFQHRPKNFEDLLQILDTELRLITPTESEEHPEDGPLPPGEAGIQSGYQLTHDYLVQPVREWLTHKQRSTLRGRTELRLEELTADWSQKPENRNLPNPIEFMSIRSLVPKSSWTASQRSMIATANQYYAIRSILLVGLIAIASGVGYVQWSRAAANEKVERLSVASTTDAPAIIDEMQGQRRWVNPLLTKQLTSEDVGDRASLNMRLAMLPDDPQQEEHLIERLINTDVRDVAVIVDALEKSGTNPRERLWMLFDAPENQHRLQLAAALARFDPESKRWPEVADRVASSLVSIDALEVGDWMPLLQPVAGSLTPALVDLYIDPGRQGSRDVARSVLEKYAGSDSQVLVRMLVNGADRDLPTLIDAIAEHPDEARSLLLKELNYTTEESAAATESWPDVRPEDRAALVEAEGLLTPTFAICQSMPLEVFEQLQPQLADSGYRPICVRPYSLDAQEVRVAVAFVRDGRAAAFQSGLAPEEVDQECAKMLANGWLPVDVAGYQSNGDQFLVLWSQPADQRCRAEFNVGKSYVSRNANVPEWISQGLLPQRRQMFVDSNEKERHSMVWGISADDTEESFHWQGSLRALRNQLRVRPFPVDLGVTVANLEGEEAPVVKATAIWRRTGKDHEAVALVRESANEHLEACRTLAQQGYRPVAMGVAAPVGELQYCVSVWHRPVPSEAEQDERLLGQAKAAVALIRLGDFELIRNHLQKSESPDLRSLVIHTFPKANSSPDRLLDLLPSESDNAIRQAMLLTLGEYPIDALRDDRLAAAISLLAAWYRSDPDPAIHSATRWCLRRWNCEDLLSELDEQLASDEPSSEQRWYVTPHGETFAVIDARDLGGPFLMGCPETEVEHGWFERLHLKYLRRKFAIATEEVSVAQFREFLRANPDVSHSYSDAEDLNHAQTRVTWYLAARYCNWRSEMDGLPPDEWCYEPNADGLYGDGMKLAPDYLRRRGYRLPTETEWEFSCRSGARAARHFGDSAMLLPEYAWYLGNANNRIRPTGLLKPNGFGLFDMLGNAQEWCQERYSSSIERDSSVIKLDFEDAPAVNESAMRATRGGSVSARAEYLRSADKIGVHPHVRSDSLGFRLAQTIEDVRP